MPLGQRAAPGADLLRPKVGDQLISEHGRRLREQPAQLLDRRRRRLMDPQILLDQLRDGHLAAGAKPRKLSPERSLRFVACREAAHLRPLREAPIDAIPIRPPRLAVAPATAQLQNLTVLCHLAPPPIDDIKEAMPRRPIPDPFSPTEGVAKGSFLATSRATCA